MTIQPQRDAVAPDTQSQFDSLLPATDYLRRGFIATAIGAGFALATQPVAAQTAITTDTQGLLAGAVRIPLPQGELQAYRAAPAATGKAPIVLVVSEIFGVHECIADGCRRLAKAGHLAVAPELFSRYGDPKEIDSVQQILAEIVARTPDATVLSDLDATAA